MAEVQAGKMSVSFQRLVIGRVNIGKPSRWAIPVR